MREQQRKMIPSRLKNLVNSEKFVINIGDDGAILTLFKNKLLVKRLFAAGLNESDTKEFKALFLLHPKASISILIDTTDQTYNKQKLPPVSRFSLTKLVQNRLKREFNNNDFTGAIKLNRDKTGRHDWNYVFVSVANIHPLSDWITFIEQFNNPLNGFFLLPLELARICNNYTKNTKKREPGKNTWKILVVYNKISGLRQIILKNNKIIFTRITNISHDEMPEIIAGEIEQEVINTIDYIRRLTGQENIHVTSILSLENKLKQHIDTTHIPSKNIHLLSPFELATTLKISNACKETDKFCDTLTAAHLVKYPHSNRIHTPQTHRLRRLITYGRAAIYTSLISLIYLTTHLTYTSIAVNNLNKDIAYTAEQQVQIQSTWQTESKALGGYDITTATRINNITSLYRILSNNTFSPLHSVTQLIPMLTQDMQVKNIQWTLTERPHGKTPSSITFIIELTLFSKESSIQKLFDNFDQFITQLEDSFANYTVKYSRLPSKFKVDDENKAIPIKINITGPNKK